METGGVSLKSRLASVLSYKVANAGAGRQVLTALPSDRYAVFSDLPKRQSAIVESTAYTDAATSYSHRRTRPGKPAAAKKVIEKKPKAKIIGAALLEELHKLEKVGTILDGSEHGGDSVQTDKNVEGSDASDGSDDESVAEEARETTQLRSSLRDAQKTHRVARVSKHVGFAGKDGGECTHIFLYEPTKVKLPWTGPRGPVHLKESGEWLKVPNRTHSVGARPRVL